MLLLLLLFAAAAAAAGGGPWGEDLKENLSVDYTAEDGGGGGEGKCVKSHK